MKKLHTVMIALESVIIGSMVGSALTNAFTENNEKLYVYSALVILSCVRCIMCERSIRQLENTNDWLRHQILRLVGLPPKDENPGEE